MLNRSKGPAMWSPRVQSDRMLLCATLEKSIEQTQHLDFYQEMVKGLVIEKNKVVGVETNSGSK